MSSSPEGSVTQWIRELKSGDAESTKKLWDRYFNQLISLANRKLLLVPKQESDEEDVVVQALNSFFSGAKRGRFPKLCNRDDLWSLLASIVENKAHKVRTRHKALKRGGDQVRVNLDLDQHPGSESLPTLEALSLELREQLSLLKDEQLRRIVVLVLYGHTNAEIAEKLDLHIRTVERRRLLVKKRWEAELQL